MPDFYLDSTLAQDLAAAQTRKAAIGEQITALEAEETALDEKIAEIQSVQAYIADNFPPTDTAAATATFTATPSSTQVALAWSAVTGSTSFRIERSTDLTDWSGAVLVYSSNGTSYNNTGLTNGTTYYYRIATLRTGYNRSEWVYASATPNP